MTGQARSAPSRMRTCDTRFRKLLHGRNPKIRITRECYPELLTGKGIVKSWQSLGLYPRLRSLRPRMRNGRGTGIDLASGLTRVHARLSFWTLVRVETSRRVPLDATEVSDLFGENIRRDTLMSTRPIAEKELVVCPALSLWGVGRGPLGLSSRSLSAMKGVEWKSLPYASQSVDDAPQQLENRGPTPRGAHA
jgi:hypothetical protein